MQICLLTMQSGCAILIMQNRLTGNANLFGGNYMNIVSLGEEVSEDISWEDIDFGEICIFENQCGEKFIGMKVYSEHSGYWLVDLSDNPSSLYKDGNVYRVLKKIKDATLTIKT